MAIAKKSLAEFHSRLRAWYDKNGRKHLPWRNTLDPYPIYLSEIMLQQTQVTTVLERYYFPFLERFPTLEVVAKSKTDNVLKAWQGLGYYNRAANLHRTAVECGGILPDSIDRLLALPGIGRNTAHAIAAFAYRQPVAVLEANVKRVICRIHALKNPVDKDLWVKATDLLDTSNPFDYNQAMMDIGAMICTKRAPQCHICPASILCKGQHAPEFYPAPRVKKAPPVRKKKIIVLRNKCGHYYASPRPGKFLAGLYHFCETDAHADSLLWEGQKHSLAHALYLGDIRQQYSHFTLEARIMSLDINSKGGKGWYSHAQLIKLPSSMAEQKILQLLA